MKINDFLFFICLIISNCLKFIYLIFNLLIEFIFIKKCCFIIGRVYFCGVKLFLFVEIWLVRKGIIFIFINCLLIDWCDIVVCFNSLGRNFILEKFGFDY